MRHGQFAGNVRLLFGRPSPVSTVDIALIQRALIYCGYVVLTHGGSLDRVLRLRRFPSFAAHQPVEGGKICTLPPFGEEGGRVHRRELFRNGRGDELIYAHAISLGAALDFCFN